MFTGIIEEVGTLLQKSKLNYGYQFKISCKKIINNLELGASIACNGICLTVFDFDNNSISIEVMKETTSKTTINNWKVGDFINLERAMTLATRLDGHIVQGHIDKTATLVNKIEKNNLLELFIKLSNEDKSLIVPQGSIAINGVSLTIAEIKNNIIKVSIVDFTKKETNLADLKIGNLLNIEFDIIGKYILRRIKLENSPKITEEYLLEKGF